jgi:hypothetical protein
MDQSSVANRKSSSQIKGVSMPSRLNYGKTFLLGFVFFDVSVIWGVYNAFACSL